MKSEMCDSGCALKWFLSHITYLTSHGPLFFYFFAKSSTIICLEKLTKTNGVKPTHLTKIFFLVCFDNFYQVFYLFQPSW